MGKALYRKYRSKQLDEIVGQEHITSTLSKALRSGRISHAYLFSGPRGVGKTSIARILAHEINDLPYTDDAAHLDIIEIDAASNRRIDEVRDIRDKVYIAPSAGKYKVYIIDEVHMLTREAFNALLKTLEEPPAHAVFILATTEAHKLPETIVSRTQHYTFKPVEQDKVVAHLKHIAASEEITISDDALTLLAAHGDGSFRDSISLLDQASSMSDTIEIDDVRRLLGIAPDSAIDGLLGSMETGASAGSIMTQLHDLSGQGLQAASIARQLTAKLRDGLAQDKPLLPDGRDLALMRNLLEIPASHNPDRLLELVLIEAAACHHSAPAPVINLAIQTPASTRPVKESGQTQPAPVPEPTSARHKPAAALSQQPQPAASISGKPTVAQTAVQPDPHPVASAVTPTISVVAGPEIARALDDSSWPDILNSIKKEYNTLYGVLRMAKPVYGTDAIELQFQFAFHQKRLNEVKNRQIIADFIKQITGQDVSVQCTLHKRDTLSDAASVVTTAAAAPGLESITDIFGGGEVLGS